MDAYTSFAQVYDLFMDNVPYDEWCAYICETLKKAWNCRRTGAGSGMRNRRTDPETGSLWV